MKASRLLKSYRARSGYTLAELCDKLSRSRQTYNKYELNPNSLPIDVFMELIDVFELSDDDITNFLHALKQDNMSDEVE